ncbi:MAG: SDR family NAD(P)-dependent oxidoreductase [Bacteroidota bacterium]
MDKKALIIGGMSGIGREFAKLAAKDWKNLMLIDEREDDLLAIRKELGQVSSSDPSEFDVYVSEEKLSFPDSAENIYTDILLYNQFNGKSGEIDLLINVLEFHDTSGNVDMWEESAVASPFNIATLMEINQYFFRDMIKTGEGEILNVIAKPETMSVELEEMYSETQALLLEFSHELNKSSASDKIGIHTLCTSENSFVLQAQLIPEHVAHDLTPPTCSAEAIAGYGYQVINQNRARGQA